MSAHRVYVIGYDLREPLDSPPPDWSQQRRDVFLINPLIYRPLSVDTSVWYTSPLAEHAHDAFQDPLSPPPISEYEFRRVMWRVWGRLADACNLLDANPATPATLICLTVHIPESDGDLEFWEMLDDRKVEPCQPAPDWPLLGYDVADRYLLSGLTNCSDESGMPTQYRSYINDFGLFTTLDGAEEFRRDCDLTITEHAPFYVFGIYQVPVSALNQ